MKRETTGADVLLVLVSFAASTASMVCALLALFQDRESLSALFAVGSFALVLWCGARVIYRA